VSLVLACLTDANLQ
jgi:serine/threonine protein kinase